MTIVTSEIARLGSPACNYAADLCVVEFAQVGKMAGKVIVAASMFIPRRDSNGGEKPPRHELRDGWNSNYGTRTAWMNALVVARSKLGFLTTEDDVQEWKRQHSVNFEVKGHIRGLSDPKNKYVLKGLIVVPLRGSIRATQNGIDEYEKQLAINHLTRPIPSQDISNTVSISKRSV